MSSNAITCANDQTLCELILSAANRLVVLAPAVNNVVARAIINRLQVLDVAKVAIILDVDPEVYRLGYGEQEALGQLESAARSAGTMLQRQKGIRMGLVIADETMMVYSPTPQLIEASPQPRPQQAVRPNAILLGSAPPEILSNLGQGENGVRDQSIGLDKATNAEIDAVRKDLKDNPPQPFNISQKIRVYNAHFEFVELSLQSVYINRRTVAIPEEISRLTGSEELDDALRHSIRLIDAQSKLEPTAILERRRTLERNFLVRVPGYGLIILRRLKARFQAEVDQLQKEIETYRKGLEAELQAGIEKRKAMLIEQILPRLEKSPPVQWLGVLGQSPSREQLHAKLKSALEKAFGNVGGAVGGMGLLLRFKGITYETLKDKEFVAAIRARVPGLNKLLTEFDAAEGVRTTQSEFDFTREVR